MSFLKKINKTSANQANPNAAALIHIMDVRMLGNFRPDCHLQLSIADGQPKSLNVKPRKVYQEKLPHKMEGLEVVLSVDMIIPIQGTHIIIEIVEHHTFHSDIVLANPEVLLVDMLSILKQSDQEVVVYPIPDTFVKLTVKKESLSTLLHQAVVPGSLIEFLGKAKLAIDLLMSIGDPLSQLHPTAQLVVGLIKSVVGILEQQKLCYEKLSDLFEKMTTLLPHFERMQKLKNFNSLQPVIKQILDHMEASLKIVLSSTRSNSLKQFLDFVVLSQQANRFADLSSKFDSLYNKFDIAFQADMAILQDQLVENAIRETLARLDYVQIMPGDQCMQDTKVDTLADIQTWTQSTEKPVFWLCGPAGTGKSTIAATVASQLTTVGRLAAFYTCRRDHSALSSPLQLLRNICYRLALVYRPFGQQVARAIESDPHFGSGADTISSLFQKLLKQPLKLLTDGPTMAPFVVVIDALDECGKKADRIELLKCLLELTAVGNWIKVFITSRKNPEIESHLQDSSMLCEINTKDCYRDVETFVRNKYSEFNLSEAVIQDLISTANGLFIWAMTAFRFLEQSLDCNNASKLLLKSQSSQLHTLYKTIISNEIGSDSSNVETYQQIMTAILLAAKPLSVFALSQLTECSEEVVENMIQRLHSVISLNGHKIVNILHPSLAEYLLNDKSHVDKTYHIDSNHGHSTLVSSCLQVLKSNLKFNMYDIPSSYMLNKEVAGLQERQNDPKLSHIHYAALFWTFHLAKLESMSTKQARALCEIFGGPCTLYWMEILSLHNSFHEGLRGIQHINQIKITAIQDQIKAEKSLVEVQKETHSLFDDLYHFVDLAKGAGSVSIPHIYLSCLPIMPKDSILQKQILPYFKNIVHINGIPEMWIPYNMMLDGHSSPVFSVAYSPDGRHVVSGSSDKTVRIWNATTGQPVGEPLQGHSDSVWSVAYSPDGRHVVSGSNDKTVRIWDATTGQPVGKPLDGHSDPVLSVAYSPDGRHVVSGSSDMSVRIWDAITGQPIGDPFEDHSSVVSSVAYSPDGRHVVSGSWDDTVRIRDATTGQPVGQPLQGHSDLVWSVAYSPDGKHVVSGSWDDTVRIWDATTGQPIGEPLQGHSYSVRSVAYSPDGRHVVSGSLDMTVRIWDATTSQPVGEPLQGHSNSVYSVGYSPDGKHVVSASEDKTVRIWDATTSQPVGKPLQGHSDSVHSVVYSLDGRHVVSGSHDNTVRIWDTATGQPVGEPLEGHSGSVWSVVYSPDGRHVVSGSSDNTVRIWDATTGQPVGEPLQGHSDSVWSVAYSPNGKHVVSGSEDKTVRIWNTTTGQLVGEPLQGHNDSVWSVAYSPDGRHIVSGSSDQTIRIWDAATGQPVGKPLDGHS
ncbi:WD40 repeat-like protein, partial [Pluteus cervinus]